MSIFKKIINSLFIPEWCCAVRFNGKDILPNDTETPFTVIRDSYRYWTADPFLYKYGDKYYLFFEMYDRLKRKGLLGCREISDNGYGKMRIIWEEPTHLSYPFIFSENGNIYIIPESGMSHELFRLRSVDFPYKWEKDKTICSQALADTTLLDYDGIRYYISEKVDGSYVFDRVDLFYEENGKFFECNENPVKSDVNTARCAGNIFNYNGRLIRPSQNCGKYYGEKLNFNEILSISKNSYNERFIKEISVSDIKLNVVNNFVGIHTYNKLDNIEVIDLKISGRFNLLSVLGAVIKRIKNKLKK